MNEEQNNTKEFEEGWSSGLIPDLYQPLYKLKDWIKYILKPEYVDLHSNSGTCVHSSALTLWDTDSVDPRVVIIFPLVVAISYLSCPTFDIP